MGAVWMIPTALGVIHFGFRVLEQVSATVGGLALSSMLTTWDLALSVLSLGVALIFGALVVAWWPRRIAPSPSPSPTPSRRA
jgi:hypothetical protein